MKTEKQMAAAAAEFAARWKDKGYERGQSQLFWADLLTSVYGVENLPEFIRYEEQVASLVDSTNFIDVHIPSTKVLIEQKSINVDLRKPVKRGDGYITPFLQAKLYIVNMRQSEHPKWVVTCNFKSFLVYDMNQPNREPEEILLKDLGTEYYRLKFLVDEKSEHITKEMEVSMQAGEIVGRIYDALLKQYDDNSQQALRWLNILCVRIVFCLYAEDAGVFTRDQFHDYLVRYDAEDLRNALIRLFEVLNTPTEERSKYMKEDLKAFPYTNGGLFAEEIEIPQFTEELKRVLLQNASQDFDWSKISPTIFGAMFESTLNPETRRSGGMHYTSIENIHKVIDPLFLNDLRNEFNTILEEKVEHTRIKLLNAFQDKLASLTFLDPACGSGNFLTETYLSLRRLENEVIRARQYGQSVLGAFADPVKVSINQFYGIEINDFAVTVATTALWISEAQMLTETEKIVQQDIDFLPLKAYHNIREGNALRMDWEEMEIPRNLVTIHANTAYIIPEEADSSKVSQSDFTFDEVAVVSSNPLIKKPETVTVPLKFDYVIGNPPFVGARQMDDNQKQDVIHIFGAKWKNVGNLDYVCCWYKKAVSLIANKHTRIAFVSTNSICQGEQVANLWKPLMDTGLRIDFAHRTFRWDNEASLKAHVHCVIVGFSHKDSEARAFRIFDNDREQNVTQINAYLMDAPDVFIESRNRPISDVPPLLTGSQRIDNDLFMFTDESKNDFIRKEPKAEKYFRLWYGADEFINRRPRWVLYLGQCSPSELRSMPHCMDIIEHVRDYRKASKRSQTVKAADYPNHFGLEIIPKGNFMIIPVVSSEKRRYVPIGFMSPDVMCSNQVNLIPDATLYHFGVLESNVHMAWMRAVCGRLEMRYRYSKDIVYNNFPWPAPTDEQKAKIEQTAQAILNARALYPDSSLADLYDDLSMPVELRKAHQENDRAVMQAYGFPVKSSFTESQCVAELFKMYKEMTTNS